jgi:putative transposase
LQEEFGTTVEQQRCWVHKTANVLDKLPKSLQGRAKEMLHDVSLAPTRHDALTAYDRFITNYQLKYPKACDCLEKDKEVLFTFYDFPAEHWSHLRTTNPIESTFATVRLRTRAHQRVRLPPRDPDDGLQARARSPERLAST